MSPHGDSSDTSIAEGTEIYLVVYDPDENRDCSKRDSILAEVTVMDPATGAILNWLPNERRHRFEETGQDTGLFVSNTAFRIGGREGSLSWTSHHSAGALEGGSGIYAAGAYIELPVQGRIENKDTLVFVYTDPSDATDTSVALLKVEDAESFIEWDRSSYASNAAAVITVYDPDENADDSQVEQVPVFVVVDPGLSVCGCGTESCLERLDCLIRLGGVSDLTMEVLDEPLRWYNIYDNSRNTGVAYDGDQHEVRCASDGRYYLPYPVPNCADDNPPQVGTEPSPWQALRVSFVATETRPDSGVFQLELGMLSEELGFEHLESSSLLLALYLDPNDPDDVALATASIGESDELELGFSDGERRPVDECCPRDACHVYLLDAGANLDACCPDQVGVSVVVIGSILDAERLVLNETSCNSAVFSLPYSFLLRAGFVGHNRSYGLDGGWIHNGYVEAVNGSTLVAYYSRGSCKFDDCDVHFIDGDRTCLPVGGTNVDELQSGAVGFATMEDSQVLARDELNMHFLDRQGNRVFGYLNSDCVFIEVIDPDQNEDSTKKERIPAYQSGGPLPLQLNERDIFGNEAGASILVANPRNRRWARLELFETATDSAVFVSRTCIRIASAPGLVSLGSRPGDTIIAYYQDPSSPRDVAACSIGVGVGSSMQPWESTQELEPIPTETELVNEQGKEVQEIDIDGVVCVRVTDISHRGSHIIPYSITINDTGKQYHAHDNPDDHSDTVFITEPIPIGELDICPGDSIVAVYADPREVSASSKARAKVVDPEMVFSPLVDRLEGQVVFRYGSGLSESFVVRILDRFGSLVRTLTAEPCATRITWDMKDESGDQVPSGNYDYEMVVKGYKGKYEDKGSLWIGESP